jgi:hypothetical protein
VIVCPFAAFLAPYSGSFARSALIIEAVGVRQDPNSLADVGSAGIVRPQDTPFRIEPQAGQVSENSSKPPRSEHWGVFHEDETGSNLANDPSEFKPQPGFRPFKALARRIGAGNVLAGETAADDVNVAAPG